ncbi:MAG: hypothetical protein HY850_08175 [Betaproteobacteria bacterium]|nr:hypothetical protein [Betaproteobacteria bacterium]
MNARIDELMARIRELQTELEADLEQKRADFRYHLENRRVRFEQDVLELHRKLRTGTLRYILQAPVSFLLTAPIIYGVLLPMLLLDLAVTLYQWTCFPVYGIPRVRRADHFIYDRGLLAYLNWIERVNCIYCSYGNGLMNYAREIAARTEQYWCPIKHARRLLGNHAHYAKFFDYGDAERYRQELEALRKNFPKD